MPEQLFKKLVDEIAVENNQAIVLPFWRGESCLHPSFSFLILYALDKGLRIHISTNGHYMEGLFMDIFYHCEFVTFSVHTDTGYKNAMKFVANKPAWSNTTIQASFVHTEKSTRKYLAECTKDKELKGFDSIRLFIEHTIDGRFGESETKLTAERMFCPKLNNTLVVSAEGGYSRCNHIWEPILVPNLAQSSIYEIWHSPTMNKIRAQYPDERCMPCDQWTGCTNGESWQKSKDGQIVHSVHGIPHEKAN